MRSHGLHEDFSRADDAAIGSERNFGLTIGAALAVLGALSWYRGGVSWPWLFAGSVLFAIAALTAPVILRPLNRAWFRFGLLLARIAQPIVLGLMFYAILTPFALILRRFAGRPLGVRPDAGDTSYWIARTTQRPGDDLKNQF
jgi:Saxitoxin biosynthesis operon protein SxtJ